MKKIGFLGSGNMASLVATVVKQNTDSTLLFSNRSPEKAQALSAKLGGVFSTNQGIAQECDLIFLGIKPQMLDQVLAEITPILKGRKEPYTLVSMLAGATTATLAEKSGASRIIRIMPNTPLAVGQGVIPYCGLGVSQEELEAFAALLQGAGLVDQIVESQLDAASAVAGCGPAFCALFLEALSDGGVYCGLPRDTALRYAAQALAGTGALFLAQGDHPGAMKDKVCSPGGATIRGVVALEEGAFRASTIKAVTEACQRSLDLG